MIVQDDPLCYGCFCIPIEICDQFKDFVKIIKYDNVLLINVGFCLLKKGKNYQRKQKWSKTTVWFSNNGSISGCDLSIMFYWFVFIAHSLLPLKPR